MPHVGAPAGGGGGASEAFSLDVDVTSSGSSTTTASISTYTDGWATSGVTINSTSIGLGAGLWTIGVGVSSPNPASAPTSGRYKIQAIPLFPGHEGWGLYFDYSWRDIADVENISGYSGSRNETVLAYDPNDFSFRIQAVNSLGVSVVLTATVWGIKHPDPSSITVH